MTLVPPPADAAADLFDIVTPLAAAGAGSGAEIEEVVALLPPTYRELIVLRHSHDLSYDEIAEVTGLHLGTVKNRIFRAREAMRELLVARGITGM